MWWMCKMLAVRCWWISFMKGFVFKLQWFYIYYNYF
jgi:hypothetical protein